MKQLNGILTEIKTTLSAEGVDSIKIKKYLTVVKGLFGSKRPPSWVQNDGVASFLATEYLFFHEFGLEIDGKLIYFTYSGVDYQYQVLVEIFRRKFQNSNIYWGVIKDKDTFSSNRVGCNIIVNHSTTLGGNPIGCYVVATIDGCDNVKIIDEYQIKTIMSKAKQKAVWNEFFEEMIIKATIRSLLNQLLGVKFSSVLEKDNKNYDMSKKESQVVKAIKSVKTYKELRSVSDWAMAQGDFASEILEQKIHLVKKHIEGAKTLKGLTAVSSVLQEIGDENLASMFDAKKETLTAHKKTPKK